YRAYVGDPIDGGFSTESWGYAQSLMVADIAALQQLYGANYGFRSSDTVYAWDPDSGELFVNGAGQGAPGANRVFQTLWDGGGRDLLDLTLYDGGVTVDLAPGGGARLSTEQLSWLNRLEVADPIYASANVYFAGLFAGDRRALIEDVRTGDGADLLTGNIAANLLVGGGGGDHVSGMGGRDRLFGGFGDDTLMGGGARDRLLGQAGADKIIGGQGIDFIRGGGGDDTLSGQHGADRIWAGGGDDRIEGGLGRDLIRGGGGADVFFFSRGDGADRITDFSIDDDRLDLSAVADGMRDLSIHDGVAGALIEAGNISILLSGTDADMLVADHFIF
ncbi:MAG: hypothetical protein AAF401_05000, partial [Pseudomonadota bacterium]